LATVAVVAAAAVIALACAGAAGRPANPFEVKLGVYLSRADTGVCVVRPPATVRRCTVAQADPRVERAFGPGGRPKVPGHVVLFRLTPGPPTPDTTAVEMRFRVLHGPLGPPGPTGPWQKLGLDGPRLQEFPVSVPFLPGDQIALDLVVHGDGRGEAAAPLAGGSEGSRSFGVSEWSPLPATGSTGRPPHVQEGAVLEMNAVFERDDRTPPHLRYSYDSHQDFLHTGRVRIEVRSDSDALLQPECGLLTREAEWALDYNFRHLKAGRWTGFICELESGALRAARIAERRGGHPRVMVHLIAYDKADNRGARPKIYVFP
jgi:hypothetical protein